MMRYLLTLLLLGLAGCATVDTQPLYHQMDKADVQLANQALAKLGQSAVQGYRAGCDLELAPP